MKIEINNEPVPSTTAFKHPGVTLDKSLAYNEQCNKAASKLQNRMLTNTKWGTQPIALRKSTSSLVQSVAENACTAWGNSHPTKKATRKCNKPCELCQAYLWTPLLHSCQRSQKANTQTLAVSILKQSWELPNIEYSCFVDPRSSQKNGLKAEFSSQNWDIA